MQLNIETKGMLQKYVQLKQNLINVYLRTIIVYKKQKIHDIRFKMRYNIWT